MSGRGTGLVSTLLTLLVIPVLYYLVAIRRGVDGGQQSGAPEPLA